MCEEDEQQNDEMSEEEKRIWKEHFRRLYKAGCLTFVQLSMLEERLR